jgi:hypothetical protein
VIKKTWMVEENLRSEESLKEKKEINAGLK